VSAQIGTALLPAFSSLLSVVSDQIMPVLAEFWNGITRRRCSGGIDFVIAKVKELAPKLLQGFVDMFNNVGSWVASDGKALIVRYFNFLTNALTEWVLPALPKLIMTRRSSSTCVMSSKMVGD
jgi:hypothetical protein